MTLGDRSWAVLKVIFKLAFTVAALYWVVSNVDLKSVMIIWSKSDPLMLFGAFIAFFFSQLFASSRIRTFLNSIGIHLSAWFNYKLYLLGMFYNMFLPGGVGGDGYKIFLLRKEFGTETRKLIVSVFLDKLSGLWALTVISLVLMLKVPRVPIPPSLIWILLATGTTIYYIIQKFAFKSYVSAFLNTHAKSLGLQLCQLICVVFILKAINVSGEFTSYLLLFMFSSLVALFPLTIGGLGARELVFLYGAELLVLDAQRCITISLIFYVISALNALPGIYLAIFRKKYIASSTVTH
jgi:uncharacterized membrane protein YbhN (UPF0104 family)